MDDNKILSSEEVDALSKVAHSSEDDLTKIMSTLAAQREQARTLQSKTFTNIIDLTWSECEKILSAFIRKKTNVKFKSSDSGKLSSCLVELNEKQVYSVFQVAGYHDYVIVVNPLPFLHQSINALFGGALNPKEAIMESPGKIGLLVAEKLGTLVLEGFSSACKEYGKLSFERVKTVTLTSLISKFSMDEDVYRLTYIVSLGEIESEFTIIIQAKFLDKFLPKETLEESDETGIEHDIWRDAIKSQVIDSDITIIASLPSIRLSAKELLDLKEGDLIPISDPTSVKITLNDVQLFLGQAAQANEKRIVKILDEK